MSPRTTRTSSKTSTKRKRKRKPSEETRLLKRLAIIFGVIVLVFVAGVALFVYSYKQSSHDVEVVIETDTEAIHRGVPFEIAVTINNRNGGTLTDAELTVGLSRELAHLALQGETQVRLDEVGDIGSGSLTKRTFRLLPVGEVDAEAEITATLTYHIGDTRFEKQQTEYVTIESEQIQVSAELPDQILGGSVFPVALTYINASSFEFKNLALRIRYPSSYTFVSADLEPDEFNNYWELGALNPGSEGTLTVRGILDGAALEDAELRVTVLATFLDESYEVAHTTIPLQTAESPLHLDIDVSGGSQHVARIGDVLHYTLTYANRSGIALHNAVLKAELTGELFAKNTLVTNARFDDFTNTLIWDSSTNTAFELLEPGASGSVSFAIGLAQSFPITRLNDKNFSVRVTADMESPTVPYYLQANKTAAAARVETKIAGQIDVDARAFFRDAPSGIANTGSLPPRVGEPTQYTVHWIVRNYATDVTHVSVSAPLPAGVTWSGIVKSNVDSVPLYDADTRTMTWELDQVAATRGVIGSPLEAIFQVTATPSSGQIGQFQSLLGETSLTATDDFTGITLRDTDTPLNTSLPDDTSVGGSSGLVIQ